MKFLAFNLLAAVALVYLFSGADGPSVEGALERASETAQSLVDKGRQAVAKEAEAPEPKPEPVAPVAPVAVDSVVPVAEPKPEPVTESKVAAAPVPTVAELAKLLPVDQAVAQRRAEVMAAAAPAAQASEIPKKPAFMSRGERQRELHRLAQEMELMFVDKVVR